MNTYAYCHVYTMYMYQVVTPIPFSQRMSPSVTESGNGGVDTVLMSPTRYFNSQNYIHTQTILTEKWFNNETFENTEYIRLTNPQEHVVLNP